MSKKRRPATKAELLDRMPRAFRPKLWNSTQRDLGLTHNNALDGMAREPSLGLLWEWVGNVLTWWKVAELLELGQPEMQAQLDVAQQLVQRYINTGRIGFTGPEYTTAKLGVMVMDELASRVGKPTAVIAADWCEIEVNRQAEQAAVQRAQASAQPQERIAA